MTASGQEFGLLPCGLGARDTLRLEAGMALYGNDIDDTTTPLEAGLGWIVKLGKEGGFLGRDVLARQKEEGPSRKLTAFELLERGIARHGYPCFINGEKAGEVTSGTQTPFLKKSIGLAYLPAEASSVGTEFAVEIRNRKLKARVIQSPPYKRPQ